MKLKTILVVAALLTATTAQALETAPGMKMKVGLLCNHPQLAWDLYKVQDQKEIYMAHFHALSVISGRCLQSDNLRFTLVSKIPVKPRSSYDGHRSELWEVEMPDGETWFGLIWPDVEGVMEGSAL